MADRSGARLAPMLRWKGNPSHFLIAARSGKSFLKTTCSAAVQPAHFGARAQKWRLAGPGVGDVRTPELARNSPDQVSQTP